MNPVDQNRSRFVTPWSVGKALFLGAWIILGSGSWALAQSPTYRYSPYEKPDPFFPAVLLTAPREAVGPLQRQPLSSLVLVGTILGREASALIMGKGEQEETATYVVKVGDKIGSKSGTIISILADRILVREPLDHAEQTAFRRFQDLALMIRPYDRESASSAVVDLDGNNKGEKNTVTEALTLDVMPRNASSLAPDSASGQSKGTGSETTGGAAQSNTQSSWLDQQVKLRDLSRSVDEINMARRSWEGRAEEPAAPNATTGSDGAGSTPTAPFGATPITTKSGGVSIQQYVPQGYPGYPPLPGQGAP
jgi:hypothetical protein